MAADLHTLTAEERHRLGLHALLNAGALAGVSRETGISISGLQQLRQDFVEAAREGLNQRYGPPASGADADRVQAALREMVAPRLFELGGLFDRAGDGRQAGECLARAAQLDPTNGFYLKGLALHLHHRLQPGVEEAAQAALAHLPGDPECGFLVATARWRAGDDAAAVRALTEAGRRSPPAYLVEPLADLWSALDAPARALEIAEQAYGARPEGDGGAALYALAKVHRRQGRPEAAAALLERGLERAPGHPAFEMLLAALECADLQRPDAGIARLQALVARRPDDPTAHCALSAVLRLAGRWVEATEHARAAVLASPRHLPALRALLECHRARGDLDALRDLARYILDRDPANVPARICLLESLVDDGDAQTLARELESVRRRAPDAMALPALELFVAHETGDEDAREALTERLCAILPRAGTWQTHVGLITTLCRYLRLGGQAARAGRILAALPRADRAQTEVVIETALAAADAGEPEAARALLEQLWKSAPQEGLHGARLAAHLVDHHGDVEAARAVLDQTRRQASWNDAFVLGFAMARVKLGEPGPALQLVYDYFVDQGRVVPCVSRLHTVVEALVDAPALSREQRLAARAVLIAGQPPAEAVAAHVDAVAALAETATERAMLDRLRGELGPPPAAGA